MYPHFIEVHGKHNGNKICVNIDSIKSFYYWERDGAIRIDMTDCDDWLVEESYDDLKELLRTAGVAIQKQDPRIDTSIPLNMDDLCEPMMIGEPVWNSNTRAWMLVVDSALGDVKGWVDLCDHCGKIVRYGPHDITKYPLYRLRKELE